ncbi:MAG TPA: hypothetical protein VFM05_05305, partial [Candidatus Saccharimonadales bacterium]|nr:hypothetical protein [Candidatus Saccharimonadales bacterium]
NAPYYVVVRALSYILQENYLVTRLASVLLGLGVLIIFALLLRNWHDRKTTIIGTLLFGLSAWFLHTTRLGTPDVLWFVVFALLACSFWLKRTNSWAALMAIFLLTAAALYIPGMIWFVGIGIIWQWKVIDAIFKKHLLAVTLAGFLFLVSLIPLVGAMYKDQSLIKSWLGIPQDFPNLLEMIQNLLKAPFHLFVRGENNPTVWLGITPVLDIFALAMLVLGGYLYLTHVRLARTPLFLGIVLVTFGLMALGSPISYTVIIPILYLVIAAGVSYFLNQWFRVFPRNPIARGIGWGLISIVVALAVGYHVTHYFVGWPQASATHEVFTLQQP